MRINFKSVGLFAALFLSVLAASAQTSRKMVEEKIKELKSIAKECNDKGFDTRREDVTIHTAGIFLEYADWDEKNMDISLEAIKGAGTQEFIDNAEKYAAILPEYQRKECYKMIVDAIKTAKDVRDGKILRNKSVKVDWTKLDIKGHQIVNEKGDAVFITDFNFMPRINKYTDWYGAAGGFHADLFLLEPNLEVSKARTASLNSDEPTNFGLVHMSHNGVKWVFDEDPEFFAGAHSFMKYDIDNPKTWVYWDKILSVVGPKLSGKTCTKMGYCMANEPHWSTAKNDWSTPVDKLEGAWVNKNVHPASKYTIAAYQNYLKEVHKDIASLNKLWGSSYSSFEDIIVELPLDNIYFGKPMWYDWMRFNQVRVNNFFTKLLATIQKYDPEGYAHVKLVPNTWNVNSRDTGLDFEYIMGISKVIGNDAGVNKKLAWGAPGAWESDYVYNWNKMCMSYDFFRSLAPNKPNLNTETHYISCTGYSNFYTQPEYIRSVYWLSTMFGSSYHASWTWSRTDDGNGKLGYPVAAKSSHLGSFGVFPRSVNELAQMAMDLNENCDDIVALQNVKQPLRLFYTETSAINKRHYMDETSELYLSLFFEESELGFVTKNIIEKQNNKLWDVVMVRNNEFVTEQELKALQSYLDKGGVVLVDSKSLKYNQYQQPHPASLALKASKGKLIECNTLAEFKKAAYANIKKSSLAPISVEQDLNPNGKKTVYARVAKSGKNRYVVSLSNLGKDARKVTLKIDSSVKGSECKDVLTGEDKPLTFTMQPEETLFYEIGKL